ncbi:chemotaxis protein MotB, partial [Desulfovibrio sp. OttesenSCG-928-F20]|nr:chemotaxis protein MotB [Desulfovibrio sp. OttesenSCG-928-F20]
MAGSSWKVAYADFMTAMMAFFLVMWLLNMAPPETLQGIAGYFQADAQFSTNQASP